MKIDTIIKKILRKTRCNSEIRDINYDELMDLLRNDNNVVLIDVRSPQEFAEGRLKKAINIPWYDIAKKVSTIILNNDMNVIVYCQSGERSKKACTVLCKLGYVNVYNLKGGLNNI